MPLPLLPRVPPDALPGPMREAWKRSRALRGDATLVEVFAHHPALWLWYVDSFYGKLFNEGLVARPFKELLRLRLSERHGCRFCNLGNRAEALAAGFSEAQVAAILDTDSPLWGPAERAILKLADRIALTRPDGVLDAGLYAELKGCFNDAQILELGLTAGVLAGMAKFLFAFDLVERETECPFHPEPREEHTR